ncbi:MAG: hypothetical protein OXU20_18230 [Myxococcales bacterium]|nr:hypothetical protein [Myxococcales bacterium]
MSDARRGEQSSALFWVGSGVCSLLAGLTVMVLSVGYDPGRAGAHDDSGAEVAEAIKPTVDPAEPAPVSAGASADVSPSEGVPATVRGGAAAFAESGKRAALPVVGQEAASAGRASPARPSSANGTGTIRDESAPHRRKAPASRRKALASRRKARRPSQADGKAALSLSERPQEPTAQAVVADEGSPPVLQVTPIEKPSTTPPQEQAPVVAVPSTEASRIPANPF